MRRIRVAAPVLVGLACVTALLVASPAPAERDAPRTLVDWSGFRIDATGKAAGGFIGARRWSERGPILYPIDPAAKAGPTAYQKGRWVARVRGSGAKSAADRRHTARAAWILAKYGKFRYDVQSAAVDAAVLHLLAGGRWKITGDLGLRRIRQSGEAQEVRHFARVMLDDSARLSGPYVVQVRQARSVVVGDPVDLGIRVVAARNGRPLPYVPVRVSSPDGSTNAGTTDKRGWVRLTYAHPSAGATPIRVAVRKVPEARLRVLAPETRSRSRVVVAGRKGVLEGAGAVYVKARPQVVVGQRVKRVRAGAPTVGAFRLRRSAEEWPRPAVVTLHGPFARAGNAACGDRVARKERVRVTGAGRYDLPRFRLREDGYYLWRVHVPGNAVNLPATDCGGRFRVVD